MKFLLLWVLGGNVLDSGLRYQDAGSCYAAAQNSGKDFKEKALGCYAEKSKFVFDIYSFYSLGYARDVIRRTSVQNRQEN